MYMRQIHKKYSATKVVRAREASHSAALVACILLSTVDSTYGSSIENDQFEYRKSNIGQIGKDRVNR